MECGWDVCVAVCALVWGGSPMGESSDGGGGGFPRVTRSVARFVVSMIFSRPYI